MYTMEPICWKQWESCKDEGMYLQKNERKGMMLCELLFCCEESLEALNSHMIIGNHTFPAVNSSYNKVKMAFAGRLLDGASAQSHMITSTLCSSPLISQSSLSEFKIKGWAMPVRSKFRYSEAQKKSTCSKCLWKKRYDGHQGKSGG